MEWLSFINTERPSENIVLIHKSSIYKYFLICKTSALNRLFKYAQLLLP